MPIIIVDGLQVDVGFNTLKKFLSLKKWNFRRNRKRSIPNTFAAEWPSAVEWQFWIYLL